VSGKFLSEKAAEDLKQRIIEHVIDWCPCTSSLCLTVIYVSINME
jgi:hypothetical protein